MPIVSMIPPYQFTIVSASLKLESNLTIAVPRSISMRDASYYLTTELPFFRHKLVAHAELAIHIAYYPQFQKENRHGQREEIAHKPRDKC
jgi:hypothetical protein